MDRWIAHVDMDCFFVSCERVKNPSFLGRPLVVAWGSSSLRRGSRPRGVVTCASYEVRPSGVRAGMSLAQAVRLAPSAEFIDGSHGLYGEMSDRVHEVLKNFSPVVERASIDEFFLNLTGCSRSLVGTADWGVQGLGTLAEQIRAQVLHRTGLSCSVGIASNRMLAKIASDSSKPGGVRVVAGGEEETFLEALDVSVLPGVGRITSRVFNRLGIRHVGEIRHVSASTWERLLGKWGVWIWRAAHGEGEAFVQEGDHRAFVPRPAKSASANRTLESDTTDMAHMKRILFALVHRVCRHVRTGGLRGRTVTLRLRAYDFEEHASSETVSPAVDLEPDMFVVIERLFSRTYRPGLPIRLLGVALQDLVPVRGPRDLFDTGRDRALAGCLDHINERFGTGALRFAGSARTTDV